MASRTQILTPSNLRLDSRLPLEIRSTSFKILPSPPSSSSSSSSPSLTSIPPGGADGYALVSHGLTTVSSSIFGPREGMKFGAFSNTSNNSNNKSGDKGRVNVEVGVAGWSERVNNTSSGGVRKGGKDKRTLELATQIQTTFEPILLLHLYPRSSIDIYIQVLEVDGSLLQAAINATTLAIISAGLPLLDYICSVSLASYPSLSPTNPQILPFTLTSPSVPFSNSSTSTPTSGSGSTTLLDLTQAEEQALPNLTVAILPKSGKVSLVTLETRVSVSRFEEMLRWGVEGGKVIQIAMEEAVAEWMEGLGKGREGLGGFPGINLKKDSGREDEMEE